MEKSSLIRVGSNQLGVLFGILFDWRWKILKLTGLKIFTCGSFVGALKI